MTVHLEPSSNFHPFECDGAGACLHCDRRHAPDHDPAVCELCDPEYDLSPNPYRDEAAMTQGD